MFENKVLGKYLDQRRIKLVGNFAHDEGILMQIARLAHKFVLWASETKWVKEAMAGRVYK
jgi:hypothetical protein